MLVIAPLRVAETVWSGEATKWEHLKHLRLSKVLGSAKDRAQALKAEADIYVINRENVAWLTEHLGASLPFDMVVIDELSSFKSSKAKRFKELRKVRPFIRRIVGLTGTPAPNSLIDLWPQMYLLDVGERLGKSLGSYRTRYFTPGHTNGHIVYDYRLRKGAEEAIHSRISDICISMQSADYLDLPERIDNVVSLKLSPQERARYEDMERRAVLSLPDGDINAVNAAAVSNKLLQIASGACYTDDGAVQHIHDRKLDALEEIVEAAVGHPVLVFYSYRHELDRIKERFKGAVMLKTGDDVERWNKGETQILLAHPASAGHGLNLQDGGSTIVWFGLTWSLEQYQQANARLHRQGQTRAVVVHHLITEGTIETDVMKALARKESGQAQLLDAVKVRIRSAA